MLDRRAFLVGVTGSAMAAATLVTTLSTDALAARRKKRRRKKSRAFKLPFKYEPQHVAFSGYAVGTIVIDPRKRFLYHVTTPGEAMRYGVSVGRAGLEFSGTATIARKAEWPRWTPTQDMIAREPDKYAQYADGVDGGPGNPLGARALYLYQNGKDTLYRIHGTTQPWSIGRAASNGCIRMLNEHVMFLYDQVPTGTKVVVL